MSDPGPVSVRSSGNHQKSKGTTFLHTYYYSTSFYFSTTFYYSNSFIFQTVVTDYELV